MIVSCPASTPRLNDSSAVRNAPRGKPRPDSTPAKPMPCSSPNRKTSARRHGRSSLADEVLDRDVGNRERDQRFDDARRQRDDAVHRQAQRERVRERERRDLQQDRPEARVQQKQAEHEEDVVEPLRQDVRVAEREVIARRSRGVSAARNCPERSIVPLQSDPVDPFGVRPPVGARDGQRIRIDDQSVEPAQRARVGRHRAAQSEGGERRAIGPGAGVGGRYSAERRADFVTVDEEDDRDR